MAHLAQALTSNSPDAIYQATNTKSANSELEFFFMLEIERVENSKKKTL